MKICLFFALAACGWAEEVNTFTLTKCSLPLNEVEVQISSHSYESAQRIIPELGWSPIIRCGATYSIIRIKIDSSTRSAHEQIGEILSRQKEKTGLDAALLALQDPKVCTERTIIVYLKNGKSLACTKNGSVPHIEGIDLSKIKKKEMTYRILIYAPEPLYAPEPPNLEKKSF